MNDNAINKYEIGVLIRRRRQELSLTQEQLAVMLGISYQQVQRYEAGKNLLNIENIQYVAKALSIPVTYFFCNTNNTNYEQELLYSYKKIESEKTKNLIRKIAHFAAYEDV